jgi:hypothetical protein
MSRSGNSGSTRRLLEFPSFEEFVSFLKNIEQRPLEGLGLGVA